MPKIAAAEKKLRTKQLAQLIASGVDPEDAAEQLGKTYGWSRHTRRRYINRVFAFWDRDKRLNREAQLSRALATRDAILRAAMSRQRVAVQDVVDAATGATTKRRVMVPDPDLQAALAAADSKARLLNLTAPEKIDMFVEGLGPVLADMIEVLREQIHEPEQLARIVRLLRDRIEAGSAPARNQVIDVAATRVVRAVPAQGT